MTEKPSYEALVKKSNSLEKEIIKLRNAEKINHTLFQISNAVNTTLNLKELYASIHNSLGRLVDFPNFYIAIYNKEKKSISFPYFVDQFETDPGDIENFTENNSVTGEVILAGEPLLLNRKMLLERAENNRIQGPVPQIWIGVPLKIRDDVIGVIGVQSYTDPGHFNSMDLMILSSVSNQIALAIERKRTEEALRNSEIRFRELAELMPETIYEVDMQGNLTFVNYKAFGLFGYSQEDFEAGINVFDLISEKDRPRAFSNIQKIVQGESIGLSEYELYRKDRTTFPGLFHSSLIIRKGKPIGVRGFLIDITEQKKTQEVLVQTEKMMSVGGLAAGMAHEINNPLAGMIQNAQVVINRLSKDMPANAEAAKASGTTLEAIKTYMEKRGVFQQLKNINEAGCQAAKIVQNMLSFSRKTDSIKSPHSLAHLIDKTLELVESDYDLKKNMISDRFRL